MTTKHREPTRRDKIILYTAAPAGVLLLTLTWFGNAVGITILPIDQHHIIGQVVGIGLILYGLMHWR